MPNVSKVVHLADQESLRIARDLARLPTVPICSSRGPLVDRREWPVVPVLEVPIIGKLSISEPRVLSSSAEVVEIVACSSSDFRIVRRWGLGSDFLWREVTLLDERKPEATGLRTTADRRWRFLGDDLFCSKGLESLDEKESKSEDSEESELDDDALESTGDRCLFLRDLPACQLSDFRSRSTQFWLDVAQISPILDSHSCGEQLT